MNGMNWNDAIDAARNDQAHRDTAVFMPRIEQLQADLARMTAAYEKMREAILLKHPVTLNGVLCCQFCAATPMTGHRLAHEERCIYAVAALARGDETT